MGEVVRGDGSPLGSAWAARVGDLWEREVVDRAAIFLYLPHDAAIPTRGFGLGQRC